MKSEESAKKSLHERAFERIDLRQELAELEAMIEELRIEYEQYFIGIRLYAPDQEHRRVKLKMKRLRQAPFKNSQMNFKMRTLHSRYQTYNTYWERVKKQREEGTYQKDIFKADMRARHAQEDAASSSQKAKTSASMQGLYNSYKEALEKTTGRAQNVNFDAFKKSLVSRAKEHQKRHGNQKLTFKVVVKNGKVTVQAKAKEQK